MEDAPASTTSVVEGAPVPSEVIDLVSSDDDLVGAPASTTNVIEGVHVPSEVDGGASSVSNSKTLKR